MRGRNIPRCSFFFVVVLFFPVKNSVINWVDDCFVPGQVEHVVSHKEIANLSFYHKSKSFNIVLHDAHVEGSDSLFSLDIKVEPEIFSAFVSYIVFNCKPYCFDLFFLYCNMDRWEAVVVNKVELNSLADQVCGKGSSVLLVFTEVSEENVEYIASVSVLHIYFSFPFRYHFVGQSELMLEGSRM